MGSAVSSLIEDSRFTSFHLKMMVLCGLLVFLDGFDLVGISYVGPEIMRVVGLTKPMFGSVLSSALFGLTLGALIAGLCGDRYGRRATFIICGVVFAFGSIATALSGSYEPLLASRFVTGLGLGGATPIAVALISEYMPKRLRASLVIILYTNISLGGIVAGYISGLTLKSGWPTIFWIGGILPLLMTPLLIAFLPESIAFLISKGRAGSEITALLKKISPELHLQADLSALATGAASTPVAAEKFSLREIFEGRLALTTSILWFVFFVSLVTLYFYQAWLPTLLIGGGLSVHEVVLIGFAGQMGTLAGSLLFARLVSRIRPFLLVGTCYVGAAIIVTIFARVGTAFWAWIPVSFFAGAFLAGTQNSCNAVTALVYPPRVRATGVGWAIGFGRIGAILGPFIAGTLLGNGWSNAELFELAAIGPACAAIGCFWIAQRMGRGASAPAASEPLLAADAPPIDAAQV